MRVSKSGAKVADSLVICHNNYFICQEAEPETRYWDYSRDPSGASRWSVPISGGSETVGYCSLLGLWPSGSLLKFRKELP